MRDEYLYLGLFTNCQMVLVEIAQRCHFIGYFEHVFVGLRVLVGILLAVLHACVLRIALHPFLTPFPHHNTV